MFSSKRLGRLETSQEEIRRQLDTIVNALIVTEPRTAAAAEAFDGLRRNIAFAAQERRRLLTQLVRFSVAIDRGATVDTLRELCEQWCLEAGVARYDDPTTQPDWFTVVDGEGPVLEMVEPAWIDSTNNVLLQQGLARRHPAPTTPQPQSAPETASETATETTPETPVEAQTGPDTTLKTTSDLPSPAAGERDEQSGEAR